MKWLVSIVAVAMLAHCAVATELEEDAGDARYGYFTVGSGGTSKGVLVTARKGRPRDAASVATLRTNLATPFTSASVSVKSITRGVAARAVTSGAYGHARPRPGPYHRPP